MGCGGTGTIQGAAVTQPGALALTGNGNPEIGAINQIAVVPGLPNSIYVASVNGGVWHTSNGTSPSPTWTPLTDAYPSLSVSALAVSPLDATGNTVFAGIGKVSSAGQYGGPQVGVMRTTNGGKTWSVIGGGADRSAGECGTAHKRVRRRGAQLVLVGTTSNGLYLSLNGNLSASFVTEPIDPANPIASVASLIQDTSYTPTGPYTARFFAALPGLGVYQGLYNKTNLDIEWTKINGISLNSIASTVTGSLNIKLALHNPTGPNDPSVLYAGIIGSNKQLSNVFFTTDQGTTWQPVGTTVPAVNTTPDGANAQGDMNFSIAADPKMSNLVYIGGDRQANPPYVGNLYVGNTSNPAAPGRRSCSPARTTPPRIQTRARWFSPRTALPSSSRTTAAFTA